MSYLVTQRFLFFIKLCVSVIRGCFQGQGDGVIVASITVTTINYCVQLPVSWA